jgi:hypothetical protein
LLCKALTDWITCSYRLLALRLMAVATISSNIKLMAVNGWNKYFPQRRGAWTSIIYFNWLWTNIKYMPYCYAWGRALSRGFFGFHVIIRVYQTCMNDLLRSTTLRSILSRKSLCMLQSLSLGLVMRTTYRLFVRIIRHSGFGWVVLKAATEFADDHEWFESMESIFLMPCNPSFHCILIPIKAIRGCKSRVDLVLDFDGMLWKEQSILVSQHQHFPPCKQPFWLDLACHLKHNGELTKESSRTWCRRWISDFLGNKSRSEDVYQHRVTSVLWTAISSWMLKSAPNLLPL